MKLPDLVTGRHVSVSVSGNAVIVGASRQESGGFAYVFECDHGGANVWVQADPWSVGDGSFGDSVGISGDTAIVGAPDDDEKGGNAGTAYIIERSEAGFWPKTPKGAKLTASDAIPGAHFGHSVAVSGETAVVGAPTDQLDGMTAAGSAYVVQRDASGAWTEVAKLTDADPARTEWFGFSVAISGDTVIVGAPFDGSTGVFRAGSATIFQRNHGGPDVWGAVRRLTAVELVDNGEFGIDVAVDADTAIVGSRIFAEAGQATIFERDQGGTNAWGSVIVLTQAGAFGHSVAISGRHRRRGSAQRDLLSQRRRRKPVG